MPNNHLHRRTRLYRALSQHLALPLSAGLLSISAFAAEPMKVEWECKPKADNSGWSCKQVQVPGKTFQRRMTAATTAVTATGSTATAPVLDWVPKEQLTDEQLALVQGNCCGAYVSPIEGDSSQDLGQAEITVDSGSSEGTGNVVTMTGGVKVNQGFRQLKADQAVIDQVTREAELSGNIELREPNLLLRGESAYVASQSGEVKITEATYVFHNDNVRGSASSLERDSENIYIAKGANYTSCPPDSNTWLLTTEEVQIDADNNVATAKHVKLKVKDVPVFYMPWLRFPVGDDRVSGLLYPHINIGGKNGFDVALPYYLNLAPNYDLTLTPRFISERGPMIESEFRHLSGWGYTVFNGAWLSDDKGGDPEKLDAFDTEETKGLDRWLAQLRHEGEIGGITTEVNYTEVSDNRYFRDLGNTTQEENSRTHLTQRVGLGYQTDHWDIGLKAQQFQTIYFHPLRQIREPYKQLPRLDIAGQYQFAGALNVSLVQHAVRFDHADNDTMNTGIGFSRDANGTFITGSRARFDWATDLDKQWVWGFLKPALKAKHISYQLDDPVLGSSNKQPNVTVPVASLDAGLFFERDTTWLDGFKQTLEPRVYALYSKYEDQSDLPDFDTSEQTFGFNTLWRDDRFIGGDRIGDSQQVSFALSSRLLDDNTGEERLRASIGQIYYFADRRVSLNPLLNSAVIDNPLLLDSNGDGQLTNDDSGINSRVLNELKRLTRKKSPIVGEVAWKLSDYWRMTSDVIWDNDDSQVDRGSFALRYIQDNSAIVNLAYRYSRADSRPSNNDDDFIDLGNIDQADFSTILPLFSDWHLIARWNYDFTNKRNLETFAGVEYNSCCWRASVVARRWIDRRDLSVNTKLPEDSGIFFQIQFKGLAGSSKKVDNILSESIYGYESED